MARSFNGTSDRISVDAAAVFAITPLSLSFWIRAVASTTPVIYAEANSANNTTTFCMFTDGATGAHIRPFVRNSANQVQLNFTTAATQLDNTWHNFVYTQDGAGNVACYTDGANKETTTYTTTGTYAIDRATMGELVRLAPTGFFAGRLAHVATFLRTLTDAEAAVLGSGVRPSFLGPTHYWPLMGAASPEPDTGLGALVDGTLTGTSPIDGPVQVDTPTWIASLGRRPVPMIKGPDTDRIAGMRGRFK